MVLHVVDGVSEVDADYVSFSKYVLELLGDCQLGLMLGEVFGDNRCPKPKFQRVASSLLLVMLTLSLSF